MPKPMQLPSPLPTGSIYVIESHGRTKCSMLIHRYVELPDGHCVDLAPRLVPICKTASSKSKVGGCARRTGARR
jgi:hypothetical protein